MDNDEMKKKAAAKMAQYAAQDKKTDDYLERLMEDKKRFQKGFPALINKWEAGLVQVVDATNSGAKEAGISDRFEALVADRTTKTSPRGMGMRFKGIEFAIVYDVSYDLDSGREHLSAFRFRVRRGGTDITERLGLKVALEPALHGDEVVLVRQIGNERVVLDPVSFWDSVVDNALKF